MTQSHRQPAWLADAVFYQVYPQSFCDSNGDGIGDLPGIISKLDYIRSLGVSAIWLNPVFESPMGDAGYDVSDFRKVDKRYGTNADAARLFREAHKRGLRVVLDLVAGHTSDRHPWFRAACRDPRSRHANWYIFADEPQEAMFGAHETRIPGPGPRKGWYKPNFFAFQPALNYGYLNPDPAKPWQLPVDHPDCLAVRTELRAIMQYWLEMGCDGFRVDMANSLIKGDTDGAGLRRLWQGFRAWFDRDYPDAVLVAEWSNPIQAINAGFHIDFLIHFGEKAYLPLVGPANTLTPGGRRPHVFFERAGEGDITLFLDNYLRHYTATRGRGYISLPTGNHDFQRPRRGRDMDELRVLYAMLFTMPGMPFLYYGDEIGMRNIDGLPEKEGSMWRTGNRTPMQWRAGTPNLGFSAAPARRLYLPVDTSPDAPTVAAQEADPDSLLNFTRALIALRRRHRALGNDGAFRPLFADPAAQPSLFVYERADARGRYAVALNPGGRPLRQELAALRGARAVLARGARVRGGTLEMGGVSFGIFRLPAAQRM